MIPTLTTIEDRLSVLRHEMDREDVDCVFITSLTPSLGQSDDEYWDAVKYISGIEASGDAVVLVYKNEAFVFSDSRYKNDIEKKLDKKFYSFVLSDGFSSASDAAFSFVMSKVGENKITFSADTRTLPYSSFRKFFKPTGVEIKNVDLLDRIWMDRPQPKSITYTDTEHLVFDDDKHNVFEPREDKLKRIIDFLEKQGPKVDAFLTTNESEIGYILNLSADDAGPTLGTYGALFVIANEAYLFTDAHIAKATLDDFEKISRDNSLNVKKIHVFEYKKLDKMVSSLLPTNCRVGVSLGNIPLSIVTTFGKNKIIGFDLFDGIPAVNASVKTPAEIRGMRLSHLNDGVAFAKFLYKKHQKDTESKNSFSYSPLHEEDYVNMFVDEKKRNPNYIRESFAPISAFGVNGQCPHYSFKSGESAIMTSGLVVFDTGSQYTFGTTDFTRTLVVGDEIKEEWRNDYTEVLDAHLSVLSGFYKCNETTGLMLDSVARSSMWNLCDDYEHGTGHGIDCRGNVHGIFPRLSLKHSIMSALYLHHGMMFSVEPGLYNHGDYGIRIENIVMVDESVPPLREKGFFVLQSMTLAPYERRLIKKELLSGKKIMYINEYHEMVYKLISPYLTDEERSYFREITQPL